MRAKEHLVVFLLSPLAIHNRAMDTPVGVTAVGDSSWIPLALAQAGMMELRRPMLTHMAVVIKPSQILMRSLPCQVVGITSHNSRVVGAKVHWHQVHMEGKILMVLRHSKEVGLKARHSSKEAGLKDLLSRADGLEEILSLVGLVVISSKADGAMAVMVTTKAEAMEVIRVCSFVQMLAFCGNYDTNMAG